MVREFFKVRFGDVDSILNEFLRDDFHYDNQIKPCRLLKDTNGNQVLAHNVIGVDKKDIVIKFITKYGQKYLTITGKTENEYGLEFSINNSFPVTKFVDEEKVTAKFENGIVYITLPIIEEYKEKEINIKIE